MPQSSTPGPWRSSTLVLVVAIALVLAPAAAGAVQMTAGADDGSRVGSAVQPTGMGPQAGGTCEDKTLYGEPLITMEPTQTRNLTAWLGITMDYDIPALNRTVESYYYDEDGDKRPHYHGYTDPHVTDVTVDISGKGRLVEANEGPEGPRGGGRTPSCVRPLLYHAGVLEFGRVSVKKSSN